jgi:hypothetical protein
VNSTINTKQKRNKLLCVGEGLTFHSFCDQRNIKRIEPQTSGDKIISVQIGKDLEKSCSS